MRAAVFQEMGEPFEIQEVDEPEPDADGVVVETEASGICRSDWHVWQGDWHWIGVFPMEGQIFGHEPAGTVVEVGEEVENVEEGDQVTVPFNMSDGTCPYCRAGMSNICDNIQPLGFLPDVQGAWAEKFKVPHADQNAVVLPEGVEPLDVAGLGCRFATSFHGIVHRADVEPGDWVAVHGCGGIGLSAVHIANAIGANVIAVDLEDRKLDFAEELGAVETINAKEEDNPGNRAAAMAGGGCDVAIDALGIEVTCRNAMKSLGKRGTQLQLGLTTGEEEGEIPLPVDEMVFGERDFVGSFGMQPNRFDEIFRMMESGKLEPSKIIGETVALDDVPEVLDSMSEFDTIGFPVITEF
ncbi:MAG: zinc-dependent alcohol dehydrogenase family protein [Halobacteriales archaeon]|nr:zinc-dependent alcohol dehydrogenase family protein [Halobacteriales archaeon]